MKNKGKIGYILSGVVLGVAITTTAPTLAATVSTITAKLQGDVKVTVDGKAVAAKPINYNNQNYLPVGDIGRALGASVKFDKAKNSIFVTGKEDASSGAGTSTSGGTNVSPVAPKTEGVPMVNQGEKVVTGGISRSIDKVEYTKEESEVDGVVLGKGISVYYTVSNNSSAPLAKIVPRFLFETSYDVATEELNAVGTSIYMTINGVDWRSQSLLPGETATGFVHYASTRDFVVNTIAPYANHSQDPRKYGIWKIQ
ncbi:stalk domain-containing protein [Saccharibacillus deserti]|uniref:stalk domain-containing protein n=1 Tax=Saccharibacillus deserti TaxID=1634444 RepID=UPI00155349CB|nr:hypothetical protein [Saccharibacillus deserti]